MTLTRRGLILRGPLQIGGFCIILGVLMMFSGEVPVAVIGAFLSVGGLFFILGPSQAARSRQSAEERAHFSQLSNWPEDDLELGVMILIFAARLGIDDVTRIIMEMRESKRAIRSIRRAAAKGIHLAIEKEENKGKELVEPLLKVLDPEYSPFGRLLEKHLDYLASLPEEERELFIWPSQAIDNQETWPISDSSTGLFLVKHAIRHGIFATIEGIQKTGAVERAIRSIIAFRMEEVEHCKYLDSKYEHSSVLLLEDLQDTQEASGRGQFSSGGSDHESQQCSFMSLRSHLAETVHLKMAICSKAKWVNAYRPRPST